MRTLTSVLFIRPHAEVAQFDERQLVGLQPVVLVAPAEAWFHRNMVSCSLVLLFERSRSAAGHSFGFSQYERDPVLFSVSFGLPCAREALLSFFGPRLRYWCVGVCRVG